MKQNDWTPWLKEEWQKPYFKELSAFIHQEYEQQEIFPPKKLVFSAFEETPLADIKVVILGQDPYHHPGQAHGMCFSVNPGVQLPPSLLNIFKEIAREYGTKIPNNGYLMPWAKQGVFLLNTVMTVRAYTPKSHAGKGWETFTDHVIQKINEKEEPVVFLLWGSDAKKKKEMIDTSKHLVLESVHPSPLSANRGFFGNDHFKKANQFLEEHGEAPIVWQISDM